MVRSFVDDRIRVGLRVLNDRLEDLYDLLERVDVSLVVVGGEYEAIIDR